LATKKTKKLSGHEQVLEFLAELEHPLKTEIEEVRRIILRADERLTEHIKWNAPSFCHHDEDRITFNLRGKGFFTLVFHRGAKVKEPLENGPLIEDKTGLLQWMANDRATMTFSDMDDVIAKQDKLTELIRSWLNATSLH